MTVQRDFFASDGPDLPPAGRYRVRFAGHERVSSASRGTMWRLTAHIVGGPYAGRPAYKMLTDDLKGLEWLEGACRRLGMTPRPTIASLLAALHAREAGVSTYHYRHPTEGAFLTIRNLVTLR